MKATVSETFEIHSADHVVLVRQAVRKWATELGFGLVDQTKIITAASELARNTLLHGGGGRVSIEVLLDTRGTGLKLTFIDEGPGIPDIALAMKDGYTSKNGMGLGLGGAKRLSNEFEIDSTPGQGTRVAIVRWKGL